MEGVLWDHISVVYVGRGSCGKFCIALLIVLLLDASRPAEASVRVSLGKYVLGLTGDFLITRLFAVFGFVCQMTLVCHIIAFLMF